MRRIENFKISVSRQRHVFHADALSSVVAISDESGTDVQSYTYAAFGEISGQTGADMNRITYTARELLGDSLGLYYYRNRIMDPATGRFISEDPLGFIDGPNRYLYVGNRPVDNVDPRGTELTTVAVISLVLAILTASGVTCTMNRMGEGLDEAQEEGEEVKAAIVDDPTGIEALQKRTEVFNKSTERGALKKGKKAGETATGILCPVPIP